MSVGPGGVLYGTTLEGDYHHSSEGGVLFSLSPPAPGSAHWSYKILHLFNEADGQPVSGPLLDSAGAIYGATLHTIYRLTPPPLGGTRWTPTVLFRFDGPDVYVTPNGGLIMDAAGALYGTTSFGGGSSCNPDGPTPVGGCGIVFKLTPPRADGGYWNKTSIHAFHGAADGAIPASGLLGDASGNLYGTTVNGGVSEYGTVFRLSPPRNGGGEWTKTILFRFRDPSTQGKNPEGGLIADAAGRLYGTTYGGGGSANCPYEQCGTVFRLTPPQTGEAEWTETVLHAFHLGSPPDGAEPQTALLLDSGRDLYGTTPFGGLGEGAGNGVIFKLTPPATNSTVWAFKVLHEFRSGKDGALPYAGLVEDASGTLYGTTAEGGVVVLAALVYGGTVFKLVP